MTWVLTDEERHAASSGLLCPECKSPDVCCTGSIPDGINLNNGYRCNHCNTAWEGY
jgi:transposase-like protein